MAADVIKIIKDNEYLYGQNANWRGYFEDLADFCLPRRAWINSIKSKGERLKFNFLYSSEAIRDAKICASGFHSNITNPAQKWFMMQTRDIDLMDSYNVREWLSKTEQKMYSVLNASNFDTTMQEFYLGNIVFGTGVVLVQKDYLTKVRYTFIPIEQLNLVEDCYERVSQVYRNFKFTVGQAASMWGRNCCKSVSDNIDTKPYLELEFLHCVKPRAKRDAGKEDFMNMEYESVWISKKDKEKVDEKGFKEMPYICGRFWKDANEAFGFSPAMDVLAETKTLNAQMKTALRRAMKETDPPLQLPERGYIMPLNLNPAALNYRKSGIDADALQAIGVGAGNFQITKEMMEISIKAIQDGFYVPLFQVFGDITKQMPVIEAQQRIADNMGLLGPAVGRHTSEFLQPALARTFNILYESGEILPVPEELQGQEMDFVFLGNLVKAQKQSEIRPISNLLQTVGGIAQVKPDVVDKIDTDKTVDVIAKILTVDPQLIRDDEQVKKIREARAQAEAQAQELAQASIAATTAKDAGAARKSMKEAEASA